MKISKKIAIIVGLLSTQQIFTAVEFVKLTNKTTAPKVLVEQYYKTMEAMYNGSSNNSFDAISKLTLKVLGLSSSTLDPIAIKELNENGLVNAKGEILPYVADILKSAIKGTSLATFKVENPILTKTKAILP